ncbi:MAG: pyridoxamine 5'-phosphate oxidase family protein [Bacteroidota bacterium]
MGHELFEELCAELKKGVSKKGHPFRYFTLATKELKDSIGLRIVVLRKVADNLTLTFFTDQRSSKVEELKNDHTISALFYHPKKKMQLKLTGIAEIEKNSKILNTFWNGVPLHARKDYTTQNAPGSFLDDHESVEYLSDKNHFVIVHIRPKQIDFLQLGKPNHTRILFSKEQEGWRHQSLVP